MLIVLSGLPGTGKTTIARLLAQRLAAVHLRIDTIEQALSAAGAAASVGPEGYLVAYGIASDNLRLGLSVIADAVNATRTTRATWESVARACGSGFLHVRLSCSDSLEHQRRVRERRSDIAGHVLPTWEAIAQMRLEPVSTGTLSLDTCACTPAHAAESIARALA
ncbi:AAA family ATPase [Ramlibacter sp.]|uniref:AAA family ATPase n=1 Tax=Ramlibacter sp. TaxID=1917967 RepID=UPI002CA90944|nr:AAA family ATPase [Ramlibacter sp.]HWI83655.1 AAA family ATPase [Ramlibacter sp.]